MEDSSAQKASGARGGSLEGVEQGPRSYPVPGIPEQRFPGRISPLIAFRVFLRLLVSQDREVQCVLIVEKDTSAVCFSGMSSLEE